MSVPLLVDFAELYSCREQNEKALALLALALDHPAMLAYYRERGESLRARLAWEVDPARLAATGASTGLEGIVRDPLAADLPWSHTQF